MNGFYLDASAITKLVISEPETAALRSAVDGSNLASSRIAVVEVGKAVARVDPDADPRATIVHLAMVEFDADLATLAAVIGGPHLRALDAIHIASALRLGADIEAFITYDARQAEAARELGLAVHSPGASREQ